MLFDLKTMIQPFTVLSPQQKKLDQLIDKIEQQKQELHQWQQELYSGYVDKIIDFVNNGQTEEATFTLFNYAVPSNAAMQESIKTIVDYQTELMNTSSDETTAHASFSKKLLIVISILGAIGAISLALLIISRITNPLKRLTRAANVIATGDLREEAIVVKTKDEIKDLAQAFNTMKVHRSLLLPMY